MASTDARPVPIKNTAYRAYFGIYKNDGTLITGASGLDSEVSKDGGSIADCTNEATEIGSTGLYYLDLTSTEMNADSVIVVVKSSSTGAVPVVLSLYPEETGDINVDVTAFGGSALTASGGIPEVKINLPVGPIPSLGILENGTLQSATSSTAVLRSATSFADDLINNAVIEITGGTGAGQCRLIVGFTGSSDTASVDPNWTTTPDNTSTYIVRAAPPAPTGTANLPGVNVVAISGDATAADNLEAYSDGTTPQPVNVTHFGGSAGTFASGVPAVNTTLIEGSDATNQIRDSVVDDATRIDASALNTLSGHDPGETIMGATDLGTGSGLTSLATAAQATAIEADTQDIQSRLPDALDNGFLKGSIKRVGTTTLTGSGTGGQGYGA